MRRQSIACTVRAVGIALGLALMAGGISRADPPTVIRYQARLTDMSGVPLTGVHNLTFSIWDQETGGASLWTEVNRPIHAE